MNISSQVKDFYKLLQQPDGSDDVAVASMCLSLSSELQKADCIIDPEVFAELDNDFRRGAVYGIVAAAMAAVASKAMLPSSFPKGGL